MTGVFTAYDSKSLAGSDGNGQQLAQVRVDLRQVVGLQLKRPGWPQRVCSTQNPLLGGIFCSAFQSAGRENTPPSMGMTHP